MKIKLKELLSNLPSGNYNIRAKIPGIYDNPNNKSKSDFSNSIRISNHIFIEKTGDLTFNVFNKITDINKIEFILDDYHGNKKIFKTENSIEDSYDFNDFNFNRIGIYRLYLKVYSVDEKEYSSNYIKFNIGIDSILNNNSWETIEFVSKYISKYGLNSKNVRELIGWKIGDLKDVDLISGKIIKVRIVGFNHDVRLDGNYVGISFQTAQLMPGLYPAFGPSELGFEDTNMNKKLLGEYLHLFQYDLYSRIKIVNKEVVSGKKTEKAIIKEIPQKLWIPSAYEMYINHGTSTTSTFTNIGKPYEYWKYAIIKYWHFKIPSKSPRVLSSTYDPTHSRGQEYWTRTRNNDYYNNYGNYGFGWWYNVIPYTGDTGGSDPGTIGNALLLGFCI